MDKKRIELCIPAERNMLLIVRMTTSGVVSRAGFTLDDMDDMKMAIDEACNLMMLQKSGCRSLRFVYEYDESEVTTQIEGQDFTEVAESKEEANLLEVIRCILESMVDRVEMDNTDNGKIKVIRLTKKVSSDRRSAV